jgi:hypothetical protein
MDVMDRYDLDAMFTFNVALGLSCFIMAYEIIVLAIKSLGCQGEFTVSCTLAVFSVRIPRDLYELDFSCPVGLSFFTCRCFCEGAHGPAH